MEKIKSKDGTLIAYERSGEGPALVLVHGTTADHTRWAFILPMLEQKFTVYTVDRRGRGQSGDSATYSIEREYEDIAAVVSAIPEPVNLLGHSYGALICLEAALQINNLKKLILYEPAFWIGEAIYPSGIRTRIQALLDSGKGEEALVMFFREIVGVREHELDLMQKEPVWKARLAAVHTISREFADENYILDPVRFTHFKAPTMLLLGGDSPHFLKAATEAVHAALSNSKIVVMPGQQHIAMRTAPELFVQLVIDFLIDSK